MSILTPTPPYCLGKTCASNTGCWCFPDPCWCLQSEFLPSWAISRLPLGNKIARSDRQQNPANRPQTISATKSWVKVGELIWSDTKPIIVLRWSSFITTTSLSVKSWIEIISMIVKNIFWLPWIGKRYYLKGATGYVPCVYFWLHFSFCSALFCHLDTYLIVIYKEHSSLPNWPVLSSFLVTHFTPVSKWVSRVSN